MVERFDNERFVRLYNGLYKESPLNISINGVLCEKFDPSELIAWQLQPRGGFISHIVTDEVHIDVIGKYKNQYFHARMVEWLASTYMLLCPKSFLKSLNINIFTRIEELERHCHTQGCNVDIIHLKRVEMHICQLFGKNISSIILGYISPL